MACNRCELKFKSRYELQQQTTGNYPKTVKCNLCDETIDCQFQVRRTSYKCTWKKEKFSVL